MKLAQIYEPIQKDLDLVRDEVRTIVRDLATASGARNKVFLPMVDHLFGSSGKSLRPALVLFSAGVTKPDGYKAIEAVIRVAAIAELVHSASLIHDDVIDESSHRRKSISVHGKYGVKMAVLAGDILLSHAFDMIASLPDTSSEVRLNLFQNFAELTKQMCYGEIFEQQFDSGSHEMYVKIIELKTARLMSVCCRVGALIAGGDETAVNKFERFGLDFGYAYQLIDDYKDGDSGVSDDFNFLETAKIYSDDAINTLNLFSTSTYRNNLEALCGFIFRQ